MQWYVTLCVNIIKVISSLMCGVCVCVCSVYEVKLWDFLKS